MYGRRNEPLEIAYFLKAGVSRKKNGILIDTSGKVKNLRESSNPTSTLCRDIIKLSVKERH